MCIFKKKTHEKMNGGDSSSDDIDAHSVHFTLREGYIFKSVFDFCQIVFDSVIFRVTNTGFYMSADNKKNDVKETILCNLALPRGIFEMWRIPEGVEDDNEAEIKIPVDATNLRNLTTGILKKDVLVMWVDKNDPDTLHLEIQNSEKQRRSSGSVRLIDINTLPSHVLVPVLPYQHDITRPNSTVHSQEFQKACKAGTQIKSAEVHVDGYPKSVVFSMKNAEVSKSFPFGEKIGGQNQIFSGDFTVKGNIAAVVKCCGMTNDVRIYCTQGAPMMIGMNAGKTGGTFDIHLVAKSK